MCSDRYRYGCAGAASKYDLVANLVHDGAAGRGVYRAHIQRRSEGTWYEVQDLHVVDILPQARPLLVNRLGLGCRAYGTHIQRQSEGTWYKVQDLHVMDILPQARPLLAKCSGLGLGLWGILRAHPAPVGGHLV